MRTSGRERVRYDLFAECDIPPLFDGFKRENRRCYKHWQEPVYFLLSQRGQAIEIHMAADGRRGRLALERVGGELLVWVEDWFPWCEMLIASVQKYSVRNYCLRMGFEDLGVQGLPGEYTDVLVYKFGSKE